MTITDARAAAPQVAWDHQAAGKVHHSDLGEPAPAPDPVAHRVVHQDGPGQGKDQEGGKAHPFSKGPGDQGPG